MNHDFGRMGVALLMVIGAPAIDAGADCTAMDACLKSTLTDLSACF